MDVNLGQIIGWIVSLFIAWITAFLKISHYQGRQEEIFKRLDNDINTIKMQETVFVRKDIFETKLEEMAKDINEIRSMDISVRLTRIETQLAQIQESIEELKLLNR